MGTAVAIEASDDAAAPPPERHRGGARAGWPEAALVLVAGLLSFPRLGSRPVWLDEAYTVGGANQLFDNWRATENGGQALHYLLMWPVTRLSTDPVWIRFPSAVMGLVAVVLLYRVGRRLGGPRVAVLAAGGLALSWGLARYSVEARVYTLTLVLVTTSWMALIAALQADTEDEDQRRRWWWTYYVATALIPLAHGLHTLQYAAQVAALAVAPKEQRRELRRMLRVAPVLVLEFGIFALLGTEDNGLWVPELGRFTFSTIKQLMLGFGIPGALLGALTVLAIVLALRTYLRERDTASWLRLLPAFWALGAIVLAVGFSAVKPVAADRYVFGCLPGFFLLQAGVVARLQSTRRVVAAALPLGLLLLVDQPKVSDHGLENWSGALQCIADNVQDGDRFVTSTAHRSAVDYFWPDHPELANLEPLSPQEPFDTMARLYERDYDTRAGFYEMLFADTSESVWHLDRGKWANQTLVSLAFDRRIPEHYKLREAWFFEGGLVLSRLDPIGVDRPRGLAPCDTVRPPGEQAD